MRELLLDRQLRASRFCELVRFAIAGGLSAALNLSIVIILTERYGLYYLVSMFVCFVTVTFVSFVLNRTWTFRKREAGVARDLGRYIATTLIQIVLSLGSCAVCVEILHMPYQVAIVLLSVLLLPINYLLHRRWSFSLAWRVRSA